jgi:hypothetical protein
MDIDARYVPISLTHYRRRSTHAITTITPSGCRCHYHGHTPAPHRTTLPTTNRSWDCIGTGKWRRRGLVMRMVSVRVRVMCGDDEDGEGNQRYADWQLHATISTTVPLNLIFAPIFSSIRIPFVYCHTCAMPIYYFCTHL